MFLLFFFSKHPFFLFQLVGFETALETRFTFGDCIVFTIFEEEKEARLNEKVRLQFWSVCPQVADV